MDFSDWAEPHEINYYELILTEETLEPGNTSLYEHNTRFRLDLGLLDELLTALNLKTHLCKKITQHL